MTRTATLSNDKCSLATSVGSASKSLNQDTIADCAHQLTDASYLTLSMISYVKNCQNNVSVDSANSDYNHFIKEAVHNPQDIAILFSLLPGTLLFAILASKIFGFKDVLTTWKYSRDGASAAKNGRTAVVSTYTLITHLLHHIPAHLYHLINPIGIGVGVALIPALISYRYFNSQRDRYIESNEKIIENLACGFILNQFSESDLTDLKKIFPSNNNNDDIKNLSLKICALDSNKNYQKTEFSIEEQTLLENLLTANNSDEAKKLLAKLPQNHAPKVQGSAKRALMLTLSAFDAITDAPYMFNAMTLIVVSIAGIGLSTLTMGAPVIALATILVIYTLSSLFSKAYTEIQKQKRLQKSQDEIKFERLNLQIEKLKDRHKEEESKKNELEKHIEEFKKKYGVQPGEAGSRMRLKNSYEQFENDIHKQCGVTSEHKADADQLLDMQQSLIYEYISKPATINVDFKLHDTEDEVNNKINEIQNQLNQLTKGKPNKGNEKILKLKNTLAYYKKHLSISILHNRINSDKDPIKNQLLNLKAYYRVIIKTENKLSEVYGYTSDSINIQSKLNEINDKLNCLSSNNPFTYTQYKRLRDEQQLLKNLENLFKITKNTGQHKICDDFVTQHTQQKQHLNAFRHTPPVASKLNTIWRCLRSFIMGPKNIMNTIEGAIGDAVSGIAGPIIKYAIMLPLAALYGWYLTKQQNKECQKESAVKSPALFTRTPANKKPENSGAAATMHLL